MNKIILYYKYVQIDNPNKLAAEQEVLCKKLGLKGRILISPEGINGTVEGAPLAIREYCEDLTSCDLFKDMNIKISDGLGKTFPKLSIKIRQEIVSSHLGPKDLNPTKVTGKYLTAEELHDWIHNSNKEFYIVDMRNDYEQKSGHFEGSIFSGMKNFRDLEKVIPKLKHLKDKTIVTVCTGGVRCEKASGFLMQNGFNDVYQLKDGIVSYMEKYPNQDFLGKLYVFDGRVLMGFNTNHPNHKIIAKCDKCGITSENYVNCANLSCHDHFICCKNCLSSDGQAFCSIKCKLINAIQKFKRKNWA
ncbi:MAG: rhodanese-related sulfurtransferase [Candidatus Doudnabacteria bacterium]